MTQGTLYVTDANSARQGLEETVLADGNLVPNVVITDESGNRVKADAQNNLGVQNGGRSAALNQTAAAVIKAGPGRIRKIIIIDPGTTSGAFTLNDCLTTGAAAAANVVWTQAYNAALAVKGQVITLDWPCATGIVLSAVPGGGTPIIAVSYD
jgi:hypothetical protein